MAVKIPMGSWATVNIQFSPAPYARIGSEAAQIIVDVRCDTDFAGADTLVAYAFHCSADDVEDHKDAVDRAVAQSANNRGASVYQCGR
jgi:hypothetical protein